MTESIETLVVGAGVVGLAIARTLARAGHEVMIVDTAADIGTETSSRNSEVVHAGIYYPAGTLKAELCVEGRRLLYEFCRDWGVDARAIGKLIVATTEAEISKLMALRDAAIRNGVKDLAWLSEKETARIEPEVSCKAALLSPSTGIVDAHGLMRALLGDAEAHGAMLALRTRFLSATGAGTGFDARFAESSGETFVLNCRNIVNSAGHGAHAAATAIAGVDAARLPPRFLAKGNYCSVSGRSPFSHLIYPIPVPGALGTHVTLDLAGRVRLGPDIEWVDELDYSVSDAIVPRFAEACQQFWPGVKDRGIGPSYCGIRPKVHGPETGFADFVIDGPRHHGVAGLVNLFGIESPGLTSSLAIGRLVSGLLEPGGKSHCRPSQGAAKNRR